MRVGQLARRTGLTVRTLHYYDEIGLLTPSGRSEAGHRVYEARDLERLQQIVLLRNLGFPLEEIRRCLDTPDFSFQVSIQQVLSRLREQMASAERVIGLLEAIASHLRSGEEITVDEFLNTIEVMTMHEKYYTPEQLEQLRERKQQVGDERIRQVEGEWSDLLSQVRAEMEKGTDPCSASVQQLIDWSERLIGEFTGGDPAIRDSLNEMYRQEGPEKASRGFVDAGAFTYLDRARRCRESKR